MDKQKALLPIFVEQKCNQLRKNGILTACCRRCTSSSSRHLNLGHGELTVQRCPLTTGSSTTREKNGFDVFPPIAGTNSVSLLISDDFNSAPSWMVDADFETCDRFSRRTNAFMCTDHYDGVWSLSLLSTPTVTLKALFFSHTDGSSPKNWRQLHDKLQEDVTFREIKLQRLNAVKEKKNEKVPLSSSEDFQLRTGHVACINVRDITWRERSTSHDHATSSYFPGQKKKRTMLLMHKIRILWYRGIRLLDSAAELRANATCDCRDFAHRCIAAKSDRRFFDITWCITRMVLFFVQGSRSLHRAGLLVLQ